MAEKKESTQWDGFIRANMDLSGELSGQEFGESPEEKAEVNRHRSLAEMLFKDPAAFVDPRIINGALLGHQKEGLRRGTDWRLKGKIPDASILRKCIEDWDERARRGISLYKQATAKRRECFCWHMHDELRSLHPFRDGNGQTARFVLNHLRVLLGLPILILDEVNAGEYHRRLDIYFEDVFIPGLPRILARIRAKPDKNIL